MAIYRGAGGAGDATGDSASEALLVRELAAEVALDAAAAEAARVAAVAAKTAAETAETNAELAEANAETAEANAETAEANAATSATAAASSASAASTSATNAASSASAASTSASNASTSATNAASSASAASTSATAAASSASAASTSATNAASSATSAASSATSAAASFDSFDDRYLGTKTSAPTVDNDGNSLLTGALYFNSVSGEMFVWNGSSWVTVANSTSATNAANSATAAATSATNAANSATAAATSATNAANSATSASTSATTASTAATTATTQATNAATSATSASTSATNAATSATAAAGSATSAATSAAQASAVALGNEPVRHSVRPSLLLDFANTKTLDPRITFTRASTATFYDGRTVAKAEENLVTFSEQFDNAAWLKSNASVTANSTVAPDGTTTADTLTADGANAAHAVGQNYTATASSMSFSVFAQKGTNNFIQIRGVGDTNVFANYDLNTGTLGTVGSGVTATITASTNGFFRVTLTFTSASVTGIRLLIVSGTTAIFNETNTLATNVILWGAQLEQRSSVTAYTATTTAPITNYIPALQTAAANVARFEHNPVTGESLGLEIEEQRSNLLLRSEEFDNGNWAKNQAIVSANTIIAPNGTLTGDKLVEDSTTNTHFVTQNYTFTAAAHTASFFVKAGERVFARAVLFDGTNFFTAYYNLTSGSVGNLTGTGTSATMTLVGNGWYRCTITATTAAGAGNFNIRTATANGTDNYAGNGFSGIYIWGAQLEAGSFATSYIPTVASQVTRSADSASMTGTNFSSWYRADEGTIYADATAVNSAGAFSQAVATISNSDGSSRHILFRSTGAIPNYQVDSAAVVYASIASGSWANGASIKMVATYAVNNFAASYNAGTVGTDTSGILPPSVDRMFIGDVVSANRTLNSTIRKIAFYPRRLTNAELQGLTTV